MSEHPSGLPPELVWHRYTRYPFVLARVAALTLGAFVVWWALTSVEAVLFPVFLSLLLAYLLDPAVDWFEARGFDRTTGIGLFSAIGAVLIGIFLLFLLPTARGLVHTVVEGVPALLVAVETQAVPWVEQQTGFVVPASLSALIAEYQGTLSAQLPSILQRLGNGLGDLLSRTTDVISGALNLVMIPVFTFYFLRDFDKMRLALVEYLPSHNRDWTLERIRRMDEVVGAWFRGQVEVACILAGLYAVGLAITFGVTGIGATSGIAIGLMAGILNIIPYFGFVIGFGLSVLISVISWEPAALVGVLITFAVVQGLEGYVITPRVVGEKVGLSPVVVIIALLLGGELLGLLGVLLALPVAGIARVLLPDLMEQYRQSTFFTGKVPTAHEPPRGS
jgi:predicted PurR-regulated permease PerM